MDSFQADAADRHPILYAKLDASAYEWRQVEEASSPDVYRISIGIGRFFPGPFENNPAWKDQEYVLGRLESLRRFVNVDEAYISVGVGNLLVQAFTGHLIRNPNFAHLPRLADGLAALVDAFPRLRTLTLSFRAADPAGAMRGKILAACGALRVLHVASEAGVVEVLGRLPPTVDALRVYPSTVQRQAMRGGELVYLPALRLSGEQVARALGGHALEALSVELDGVPRRSAAFAALFRSLRELELELPAASQRDLDTLATYLAGARELRRLQLTVRGEGLHRGGGYDLLDLGMAAAALQLEDAHIDLAADWEGAPHWSYQHVILLNGLLRSENLRYARPAIEFPLRALEGVGAYGDNVIRSVRAYAFAFGPAALPPEMLLKVVATASGYPEWFLYALRLPLAQVAFYLQGRREQGGNIGFFREEREDTESEGGSEAESSEASSDDEASERPFAR